MADALRITAPANLPALVKTAFSRALANGDLTYYQTQVALLTTAFSSSSTSSNSSSSPSAAVQNHLPATPPFQLRFSPALAAKPKNPKKPSSTTTTTSTPSFNPFADPDPALVIAKLGQHHTLVLNKFAIVPGHFLVITNSFKPQTHLLEADDLEAAYSCVRAYSQDTARSRTDNDKRRRRQEDSATAATTAEHSELQHEEDKGSSELFVFFNSGPFSGASQPHRHLQLLPIESMRIGLTTPTTTTSPSVSGTSGTVGNGEWTPLINTLHQQSTPAINAGQAAGLETSGERTPFRIFSAQVTPGTSPAEMHAVYMSLYRKACEAVRTYEVTQKSVEAGSAPAEDSQQATMTKDSTGQGAVHQDDEAQISYNLAMTTHAMALCPRLAEGSAIRDDNNVPIGKIELNGTVLAGTALVKSEAEWDAVRRNPELLQNVLSKIGIPAKVTQGTHADSMRDSSL